MNVGTFLKTSYTIRLKPNTPAPSVVPTVPLFLIRTHSESFELFPSLQAAREPTFCASLQPHLPQLLLTWFPRILRPPRTSRDFLFSLLKHSCFLELRLRQHPPQHPAFPLPYVPQLQDAGNQSHSSNGTPGDSLPTRSACLQHPTASQAEQVHPLAHHDENQRKVCRQAHAGAKSAQSRPRLFNEKNPEKDKLH